MSNGAYELDQLNALLRQTGARWTAGVTALVELPRAEKLLRLGAEPPPGEASWGEREASARAKRSGYGTSVAQAAPPAYDWRNVGGKDFITSIQNQRSCGSCVAFGSVATVEGALRIKKNDPN